MEKGIRTMKKVLVICDVHGWAFDRIYQGMKKNHKNVDFDAWYLLEEQPPTDFSQYDRVLNLPDNFLGHVMDLRVKGLVSAEQLIQGVRSEVDLPMYESPKHLEMLCGTLLVSNQKLYERFKNSHPNVILWSGGVDTDFFEYKKRVRPTGKLKVGWSGSIGNFGREFRGVDMIEKAVEELSNYFEYVPAYREDKHRNIDEMKKYYTDEIDVFVEMSLAAGRQNGLVEAASCGVPIISCNCGIAEQLIDNGKNGFLLESRTAEELRHALANISFEGIYNKFSEEIRKTIEQNWSWGKYTNDFENIILGK